MDISENILIQVKSRLQSLDIKLWLEPYYNTEEQCSRSVEIENLVNEFSQNLSISKSKCRIALQELQEGAIKKLAARKEFQETGIATLQVRCVSNESGDRRVVEIKCPLTDLGEEFYKHVADILKVERNRVVKCISAGRLLDPQRTLLAQNLRNNQQLMVILSEVNKATFSSNAKDDLVLYDRISKIRRDVETIVDSNEGLMEMEDQDGNAVFLPPSERRVLLMAMGFYEKARAALKRRDYSESLILLLEADELFSQCNSKFLETIDNYALVNLDIVWCQLCLKNVAQLPDAQKRLEICEKNFHRSYGQNLERLITIKGSGCQERALIMRMHLLQGVVLFHQNHRNEAYEKFLQAENELSSLQVDEDAITTLVTMGYKPYEARMGLRASNGNIEGAITYIIQQKERLKESRIQSNRERRIEDTHNKDDENWVNPRSVYALMEMGFQRKLVVEALRRSKNNLVTALDLLHNNSSDLAASITSGTSLPADNDLLEVLKRFGFSDSQVRLALETTRNHLENSIEFLLELYETEDDLQNVVQRLIGANTQLDNGPTTSSGVNNLMRKVIEKAKSKINTMESFKRFKEDISSNENDYLDIDLQQELELLVMYKSLLE